MRSDRSSRFGLVVIGAGPAGLMAARRAAARGASVVVVEREPMPGGMAASFEIAGLRVDLGSHRLHPSINPAILADLRGLLGDDLQVRPRNGRLRLGGRWIAFPLRIGDALHALPRPLAARLALDLAAAPLRRPRDSTFSEFVGSRLGPVLLEEFYRPYVTKIWGIDPDDLAGELAHRRVSAAGSGELVRRIVRRKHAGGRTFLYPKTGFGTLSERLADAAIGAGVHMLLGTGVERIQLEEAATTVMLDDGSSIEADLVWSTMPVAELVRRVDPGPGDDLLASARHLDHRGLVLVYLVLDTDRFTQFDAHYFPERAVPLSRLSEPKNYRDGPDPPGRTVLCAEIPCSVGDERWTAGATELGRLVADALSECGLPTVAPVDVEVRRLPRVYPMYRPGFAEHLDAVEHWLRTQPRLVSLGRQGLFVPDNTHHSLEMGWAVADALREDGTMDPDRWRAAREGFRHHVVED